MEAGNGLGGEEVYGGNVGEEVFWFFLSNSVKGV